jgi:pimeloyl-ACP methyl ester carboxylesterase
LRDWPGFGGPVVHVPDPLSPDGAMVETLAATLAADYRVLSVEPRPGRPYQVQAMDILGMLDQFGFESPILVGERLGCAAALLVAAWYAGRVSRLVLIDPSYVAPFGHERSLEVTALRDCPPDVAALRGSLQCPVLEVRWTDRAHAQNLNTFLQIP